MESSITVSDKNDLKGLISRNSRLSTMDHFQDIRHIELNVANVHHLYNPGDILVLRPQNNQINVQKILEILGIESEAQKPFAIVEEVFGI